MGAAIAAAAGVSPLRLAGARPRGEPTRAPEQAPPWARGSRTGPAPEHLSPAAPRGAGQLERCPRAARWLRRSAGRQVADRPAGRPASRSTRASARAGPRSGSSNARPYPPARPGLPRRAAGRRESEQARRDRGEHRENDPSAPGEAQALRSITGEGRPGLRNGQGRGQPFRAHHVRTCPHAGRVEPGTDPARAQAGRAQPCRARRQADLTWPHRGRAQCAQTRPGLCRRCLCLRRLCLRRLGPRRLGLCLRCLGLRRPRGGLRCCWQRRSERRSPGARRSGPCCPGLPGGRLR